MKISGTLVAQAGVSPAFAFSPSLGCPIASAVGERILSVSPSRARDANEHSGLLHQSSPRRSALPLDSWPPAGRLAGMQIWPTPEEWSALRLSLLVSGGSTLVCLPPAIALAWLLARRRFPGRPLVDALVHLPLVLPPVAIGYLLLLVLGHNGLLGRGLGAAGVQIAFTPVAAALASAVMAFPLLVRPIRLAFELVDSGLEAAAATLGARPARVFLTVTLPLALPGVLAGAVLGLARGMGEFGATITFAGDIAGRTRTLPLALYASVQRPGGDAEAIRLMVISLGLSLGALLISELLARRMAARLGGGHA